MRNTSPAVRVLRLLIGFAVLLSVGVSLIASQPAMESLRGRLIPACMALLLGIGVVGMLLGLCGMLRRSEELLRQAESLLTLQRSAMESSSSDHGNQRPMAVPRPAAFSPSGQLGLAPELFCDREMSSDALALQLFGEIKTEIARRNWRKARMTAHRLMESCPDHPKATATRAQMKLIEENAEVEQRREIELRIGQLLKGGRYLEGIQLAEGLIKQYPASPQARAAEQLLPRLRDRLAGRELQPT